MGELVHLSSGKTLLVLIMADSYVGNTMATFVMQALGCEVAAINTVNFSE